VIGLKQDVLTSTNTIGVFNTTDFVNNGTKIELSKNTSNYVDRINTSLTTVIGLKQDVVTTTNLFANKFNTTEFVVSSDKIRINKSLELGYYQINIFAPADHNWTSTFYNYSDRTKEYDTSTTYYSDGVGSVPLKYNVSGGIRNSRVYYNNGDKIMFKNWGNGLIDVNQYGIAHFYQLWKIPASATDGWGATGTEPTGYSSSFVSGYYKQFTWDGQLNIIKDWRAWSIYHNTYPRTGLSVPDYPTIGPYNDQLAFTVESGWKYMIDRMVARASDDFCDTPLIIHVNDPYYNPDQSYVPSSV
jgi:hypothetical protein